MGLCGRKPVLLGFVVAAVALWLSGCSSAPRVKPIERGPAPEYAGVASRYNESVSSIETLAASAVVRVTYKDAEGRTRREQGEGVLQVVLPDRLALSVNKVGRRLFWIGCDEERYWWFDLVDERRAAVGRHELAHLVGGGEPASVIHPLSLIDLLGVTPMPVVGPDAAGASQWSADGHLLGLTTRARAGGYRRAWLDPETLEPVKIELFDASRRLVLLSELENHTTVSVGGGRRAVAPSRITVYHPESGTEIRMTLYGIEDDRRRISERAFDFESLVDRLGVESIIDIDEEVELRVGAVR